MKRITGIAVTIVAVLGCSYVGNASASKVCEQIFSESVLVETGRFDELAKVQPGPAELYKRTLIVACDAAMDAGKKGVGPEAVAYMLAKSVTHKDGIDSLLSLTRVNVTMAGWAAGAEVGE